MGCYITFEGPDQRFGVKRLLGGARASVLRDGIFGEALDEVTDDEVLIREILKRETGPFGKQGSRPRPGLLHQIGHVVAAVDAGDAGGDTIEVEGRWERARWRV